MLPCVTCLGQLCIHAAQAVQFLMRMPLLHGICVLAVVETCTCQVASLVPPSKRQRQTTAARLEAAQASAFA